jgi:hypothetical protein
VDLPLVSALCAPVHDEVDGALGCAACPGREAFVGPNQGALAKVQLGLPEWRVEQVIRGSFSRQGAEEALLHTDGCEHRSEGIALVERQGDTRTQLGYVEAGELGECRVARSPRWADRLRPPRRKTSGRNVWIT